MTTMHPVFLPPQRRALEILQAHPDGLNVGQVAKQMGVDASSAGYALWLLAKYGYATMERRGGAKHYRPTEAPHDPA